MRIKADEAFAKHLNGKIGEEIQVLLERQKDDGSWTGHGDDFTPVHITSLEQGVAGSVVNLLGRAAGAKALLA